MSKMQQTLQTLRDGFVQKARKYIYNPLGFKKGYNFSLYFIFAGALFGFVLARLQYLNFDGIYCNPSLANAAPGECYWPDKILSYKVGFVMHLAGILPAGLLAVFQFVPIIRYKAILYHRIAGYTILVLILPAQAGALMIAHHSFGGDMVTRAYVGILAIITTGSLGIALYNIKVLRIDRHRAWMIRAWFYFGTIITLRIIMICAVRISSGRAWATQHVAIPCEQIPSMYGGSVEAALANFPACKTTNPAYNGYTAVAGSMGVGPVQAAAALWSAFGTAGWLALFLHATGVEIYLGLTRGETERLKKVSYEKRLERGLVKKMESDTSSSTDLVVEKPGDVSDDASLQ